MARVLASTDQSHGIMENRALPDPNLPFKMRNQPQSKMEEEIRRILTGTSKGNLFSYNPD